MLWSSRIWQPAAGAGGGGGGDGGGSELALGDVCSGLARDCGNRCLDEYCVVLQRVLDQIMSHVGVGISCYIVSHRDCFALF